MRETGILIVRNSERSVETAVSFATIDRRCPWGYKPRNGNRCRGRGTRRKLVQATYSLGVASTLKITAEAMLRGAMEHTRNGCTVSHTGCMATTLARGVWFGATGLRPMIMVSMSILGNHNAIQL